MHKERERESRYVARIKRKENMLEASQRERGGRDREGGREGEREGEREGRKRKGKGEERKRKGERYRQLNNQSVQEKISIANGHRAGACFTSDYISKNHFVLRREHLWSFLECCLYVTRRRSYELEDFDFSRSGVRVDFGVTNTGAMLLSFSLNRK